MAGVSDCRTSPPPQAPADEAPELSSQQLMDAIEELRLKKKNYMDQMKQLRLRVEMLKELNKPPVTTDMVIDFIDEVYYGDQYWEMKQYLREETPTNTAWADFSAYLKKVEEKKKKFELDEDDVWSGVYKHVVEVNRELDIKEETKKREMLKDSELIILYGKKNNYTAAEKSTADRLVPACQLIPLKDPRRSHPIWKLVLQARNNEYEMNPDPRLELGKIEETVSPWYYRHHLESPREYRENTVLVYNVTPHTGIAEVEMLLSPPYGEEVGDAGVERRRGKRSVVYVTFNDPQGAQAALEKKSVNVGGREALIEKPELASASVKVDSRVVSDDDPVAKDAFEKYRKLVARFAVPSTLRMPRKE